jgi:hypothetical protein
MIVATILADLAIGVGEIGNDGLEFLPGRIDTVLWIWRLHEGSQPEQPKTEIYSGKQKSVHSNSPTRCKMLQAHFSSKVIHHLN